MTPEISVVIPTYRRETRLAFALDALAEQTLDRGRFEVLVVRDSEDPPLTVAPPGLGVRFLTMPGPGPAMRRNHGWRQARAPLVAFTDDDCRPSPGWLEALLAARTNAREVLEGRTEPDPEEAHLFYGTARSMVVPSADRWYPTCNLAFPKALLERLDGFDEELAFFGEDTDLGLRAERDGAPLVFVADAVVWHCVHVRSFREALGDATKRHAESTVLARHPDHRRELYLGAFVSEAHARWLLATAGLLLARRSKLAALAATLPYVGLKLRRHPGRRPLYHPLRFARLAADVGGEAIIDGAEVLMRARTSLRNRCLVL